MENYKKINYLYDFGKLLVAIIVCQLAGAIGAIFTTPAIKGWYAGILKPSFNPPNWIFGPVWTTLFLLMGIALFLVWKKEAKSYAIKIFGIQLVLNILWSVLFFGLKSPGAAFVEIIILLIAIYFTIREFNKISKPAAWLMAPYFLWVSFATILNYTIWFIN